MNVLDHIATALNRRDEVPNTELAKKIVDKRDALAVKELMVNLFNNDKHISHDCIKVVYEIGERDPALISEYAEVLIKLTSNESNRLQWGAMHALNTIANYKKEFMYKHLPQIIRSADRGTVITRDHAVSILIKLMSEKKYQADVTDLLLEQLLKAPVNQFPTYAENSAPFIPENKKQAFIKILQGRLPEFEGETRRKRIKKVLKKIEH